MSNNTNESDTVNSDTSETKILVAYFSRNGENYGVGEIEKGNTDIIAEMTSEETGADLFQIEIVNPYPTSYDECTEVAKQEQVSGARLELANSLRNLNDYDLIFLGYPIWWGDMPMLVYTFLESYNLAKKQSCRSVPMQGADWSELATRSGRKHHRQLYSMVLLFKERLCRIHGMKQRPTFWNSCKDSIIKQTIRKWSQAL